MSDGHYVSDKCVMSDRALYVYEHFIRGATSQRHEASESHLYMSTPLPSSRTYWDDEYFMV